MDVLPRILRQLTELLREMSSVQRVTSIGAACLVLFGFGWLVFLNQKSAFQAVSYGKVFATEELTSAEQALASAGLTGFRRDGQRLLAPAKDLDRYNAALLESDALPPDLGTQMLKQYETLGPFSTDRQRQQMKEALLLQELRRMIKAVPDVEDARVAIASPERRGGWNQKPRPTANVSVKPRSGRELSATLINSLRHVVANMVPDLKPADVTVFDVTRGQAFAGEPMYDPTDGLYLQRAREFTRHYEQQIQKALSYIPFVSVTVHVDLETLRSSMIRSETVRSKGEAAHVAYRPEPNDGSDSQSTGVDGSSVGPTEVTGEISEKQLVAAMPKAVQVCVSIPRGYLHDLISRRISQKETPKHRLDATAIEEEELTKVEQIVGRLIPAGSPANAINVTCVDRPISNSSETISLPPDEQLWILAHQWGGPFAIGCCVIFVLLMLRRPVPTRRAKTERSVDPGFEENRLTASLSAVEAVPTLAVPQDRIALLRDEVRAMVESNPAASVALVSAWLSEVHQ